jgi:hypothetical protein
MARRRRNVIYVDDVEVVRQVLHVIQELETIRAMLESEHRSLRRIGRPEVREAAENVKRAILEISEALIVLRRVRWTSSNRRSY